MSLAALAVLVLAVAGAARAAGGAHIVYSADLAPRVSGEVYRLDAGGRRVDLSRSDFPDQSPVVAARGGHVAYVEVRQEYAAAFVVGLDGHGRRRVTPWVAMSAGSGQLAWAPDGRRLLALLGAVAYRTDLDGRAHVLVRSNAIFSPSWSPDGRLVTFEAGPYPSTYVLAVHASGGVAWRVPEVGGSGGWSSSAGLLAAPVNGATTVYDTRGKPVFRFGASQVAWSPNGRLLAGLDRATLVFRDAQGRVLLSQHVPVRGPEASLGWIGNGIVTLADLTGSGGVWSFDLTTRKLAPTTAPNVLPVASTAAGDAAVVRGDRVLMQHVGGTRLLGTVPTCREDGSTVAAISQPQPVPGGRSVVYASVCGEPSANLYATGTGRLTRTEEQQTRPALSPDGTQIAFVAAPATGLSCKGCPFTIHVSRADGLGERAVTTEDDCSFDTSPSWSPDGTQILFVRSTCDSPGALMTVAATGGPPQSLHVAAGVASWGPRLIAWADEHGVYEAQPDGGGRQRISRYGADALAWSADGRLAWVNGRATLVVDAKVVATPFAQIVSVAWSPDGTRLAVAARPRDGATFDVYTLRADGSGVTRMTHDADASGVAWR